MTSAKAKGMIRAVLSKTGWALLLFALAMPFTIWGLGHSESVTQALLPHLPGVRVWGAQGALLGDFQARRVEIDLPRGSFVSLDDAAWQGLSIHPDPRAQWLFGLHAKGLKARLVQIKWVPNPHPAPTTDPYDLRLPLSVSIDRVQAARGDSVLWGDLPLLDLDGRLALGQRTHNIDVAKVRYGSWSLSGKGYVETTGKLHGQLTLHAEGVHEGQDVKLPLSATLLAKGPLTQLAVDGRVLAGEGNRAQTMDVTAVLALWQAWPLPAMHLKARQFDLNTLVASLPETSLSGVVDWSTLKQGIRAQLDLRNERPGSWTDLRLPVRQLTGQVQLPGYAQNGSLQSLAQAGLLQFKARLPRQEGGADAQLSLDGSWDRRAGKQARLGTFVKLNLKDVQLQALDARAPALTLSGNASARPDRPLLESKDLEQAAWDLDADLTGVYQFADKRRARVATVLTTEKAVEAVLSARWQQGLVKLHDLTLQSEGAQAQLKGQARYGANTWQTKGALQVKGFDPRVWMPWPDTLTGANRLQGVLDFDVASDWHGQASLQMAPSLLAGTELLGRATWSAPKERGRASLDVDVSAMGNHLRGQGQMPWRIGADGLPRVQGDQQWVVDLSAPALRALQPLAAAWGLKALGGAVTGQTHFSGQWPSVVTDGQLQVLQLRWQFDGQSLTSELASGKASWALNTVSWGSPLQWQAAIAGLKLPHLVVDQADWSVSGTGRDHQSAMHVLGRPVKQAKAGTVAKPIDAMAVDWRVQGHLLTAGAGSSISGWQGQVTRLLWRTAGDEGREWLSAQPFDLQWRRQGDQDRVTTAGASLSVMGVAMTLKELDWLSAPEQGGAGRLQAWLQLAPVNVSALLKSWQPQGGWGGDLIMGGQVRVNHSQVQPWQVTAQVGKVSGDLSMSEPGIEGGTAQRLGVDKVSIDLTARDGVWTLSEQFEGRVMGRLTGRQVVRTDTVHDLPDATDPLTGELDVQIASLRPWAVWVPAGWRLSGELTGRAEMAGTLGAPQYRGLLKGRHLGLGHGLLGVNLTDGQLQLDMQGDHAHLTDLSAKGGAQGGLIRATGDASLGEVPQAKLNVQADHFALFQRLDRRIVVSGQAEALLTAADIKVDGKVNVDEGLIDFSRSDAPTVGEDVNVLNGPGKTEQDEEADANGAAAKRKLVASVELNLGDKLRLKGRGLDTHLTGALKFTTPNNRPSLQGTVRATRGTYAAYGQKLDIERGAISFTGPVENPRLDILAMRRQSPTAASSDVKVGVQITGTAQDPRVSLYSDPSMSETDKLSWLVLGRGPSGLGGADIGLLQSAAVALLAGEGPSTQDNIMSIVGLDELSVRQSDGTVRDTVVNVGKQISKLWYLGYERNLNATAGNWQLIYRLGQRITLRAQTGADNAVDLIWAWRWD